MGECAFCGEGIDLVSAYDCHRCTGSYCSDHRLPENHDCQGKVHNVGYGDGKLDDDVDVQRGDGWVGMLAAVVGIMIVLAAIGMGGAYLLDTVDSPDISVEPIADAASDLAESAGDDDLDTAEAERLIHEEVNERRQQHGLAELHYHEGLEDDARNHSWDMAQRDFYAHENPEGEGPQERTTTRCRVGENIAMLYWDTQMRDGGTTTLESEQELAEYVVDGWMDSPGHRENILDERYASEGLGVAVDGDEVYVTQMFCL